MKKFLKVIGLLIAVIVIAIILITLLWLGPVVKKAVETAGSQITGVPVTVEKVKISPLCGLIKIRGLFIGNPVGFKESSAMELQEFSVNVNLGSLMSDTIVVKEILIDSPQFTYERNLKTDNIREIQKNIQAFAGQSSAPLEKTETERPTEKPKKKKPAKNVIIEHLLIRNAKVLAKMPGIPAAPIPIADIEKYNIGKDDHGASYGQTAEEIIGSLYDSIYKAVTDKAGGATEIIKNVSNNISPDEVMEAGSKALKSIGGFLKKKE